MKKNTKATKKVGLIGITANMFLLIIKFTGGMLFKSQGLIADSVNSFGDVFASSFTYIGGAISSKPEDKGHHFGHSKAEYVATFLIGIFMIIAGGNTVYKGWETIVNKEQFIFSPLLVAVPIITILVKATLYLYTNSIGKKTKNSLVLANSKDHRNDVLISLGVLIGIICGMYGYYFVDGLAGILISIIIILTGISISKEAFDILIDRSIDANISEKLRSKITELEGINHIDSIKSKPTGDGYILVVRVSVDPDMTVRDSHKIAGKIRKDLKQDENVYDVVVHVNPDEEEL